MRYKYRTVILEINRLTKNNYKYNDYKYNHYGFLWQEKGTGTSTKIV